MRMSYAPFAVANTTNASSAAVIPLTQEDIIPANVIWTTWLQHAVG